MHTRIPYSSNKKNIHPMRRALLFLIVLFLGFYAEAQVVRDGLGHFTGSRGRFNEGQQNSPLRNSVNPNGFNPNENDTIEDENEGMPKGIDYDHVEEADSVLLDAVRMFSTNVNTPKVTKERRPSLQPHGLAFVDKQDAFNSRYYLSAGGLGHPHLSLWYGEPQNMAWSWLTPSLTPAYNKSIDDLTFYLTRRPYTSLYYGGSLNKDNQVRVTHTQNITPRWNFAFDYDLISREGEYTNSAVKDQYFDVTTNYYSKDARYQLQGGFIRGNEQIGENGGLVNDNQFRSGDADSRSGAEVNLYEAQNQWKNYTLFLHQSYNTVRPFYKTRPTTTKVKFDTVVARNVATDSSIVVVKDTLHLLRDSIVGYDTILPHSPRVINTGVWGAHIDFAKWNRRYADPTPNLQFYPNVFADSTQTLDSTTAYSLNGNIFWTNDAYMDHRWKNPVKITLGVKPQLHSVSMDAQYTKWASLDAYATALLSAGKNSLRAEAQSTAMGEHELGDYRLRASLMREMEKHSVGLHADIKAQSPAWIYFHYLSNNYRWDNESLKKEQCQRLSADYKWSLGSPDSNHFMGNLELALSNISDITKIGTAMMPQTFEGSTQLMQASLSMQWRQGWFCLDMQQFLQQSSNSNLLSVPLFATKNSVYADFSLFKNALHMQTGFDIRYHTKYYADGYNPALGMFYQQRTNEVGNYLWADFFVTLRIQRACIYAKVGHFNTPFEELHQYLLLPHYPGDDIGVFYGIIWKFFD